MRIDLIGPSGTGKSTVLAHAARSREGRPWFTPEEAETLIESSPKATQLRAAMDDPELRDFVNTCLEISATATNPPSRRLSALSLLRSTCFRTQQIQGLAADRPIVHDELLLHRAFSLLPHAAGDIDAAARRFFESVPLPEAAIIAGADTETIATRAEGRSRTNVYAGLDATELRRVIERSLRVNEVAAEVLAARGVAVRVLDTRSADVDVSAKQLLDHIADLSATCDVSSASLRDRLRVASGSFHKGTGRHVLRTSDVMYCAFSTPRFSVSPAEAQRDAAKRLARFGLDASHVAGRSVLDLGSNAGAMIFQLSNFHPARALGIEYDVDKVQLATEIAEYAEIPGVRFEQGDVDTLNAGEVGVHDIVLALAIEAHVKDPDRLYNLLGEVTGDLLCFEGNASCDMDVVRSKLTAAGFTDLVDLGFCDDDIDPRNNRRPQLLARKHVPAPPSTATAPSTARRRPLLRRAAGRVVRRVRRR